MVGILGLCFYYFANQYTLSLIFGPDLYIDDDEERYLETIKKLAVLPVKVGKKKLTRIVNL